MNRDDEVDLRPARWSGLVRGALPRAVAVAALLALAVGVLYSHDSDSACPSSGPDHPTSAPASALPALPAGQRLAPPAGLVGVPIRLAEPAAVTVVAPGMHVDLLAATRRDGDETEAGGGNPVLVANHALVLGVVKAADTQDGLGAVYLALRPDQARKAVGLPEHTRFAIIVR